MRMRRRRRRAGTKIRKKIEAGTGVQSLDVPTPTAKWPFPGSTTCRAAS